MFEKEVEENGFGIGCTVNATTAWIKGAEFGYNKANEWHNLRKNPNDLPKADTLIRVRTSSGMEHICETCWYEPSGYGKLIISFYELNGEWIDDNEIIAWCEIPSFKEGEE